MATNYKVQTPHAAVIIWNYDDRMGSEGSKAFNKVEKVIVSTVSCTSISTTKSKSNPQGSFQFTLAPNKNWVSTITSGSWCAILMGNEPISADDLKKADPKKVKMIGKIETVRVDVKVAGDGSRVTQYLVTGIDWGYVFSNTIYVDNNIAEINSPRDQGQGVAVALQQTLFGANNVQQKFDVASNLRSLINIFGNGLKGFTEQGTDINRLAKAVYDFHIPKEMVEYFNFIGPNGKRVRAQQINKILTLVVGSLNGKDKYNGKSEAEGYIDPFSLQGSHSYWQVLLENSNPALNEMICELRWETTGLRLALYNRIKPFSFKGFTGAAGKSNGLRSYFQNLPTTVIDPVNVISVNAGTNWRDKYNFVEIKPQFQEFKVFATWYKHLSQDFDGVAFQREGFRPLIVETKQFPRGVTENSGFINYNSLASWVKLLREWYFDTHRMLNGTIVIVGQNEYIPVGSNIQFDAGLINPTTNMNASSAKNHKRNHILAHVENVSHSFSVNGEGARQYITTIQFVRGIIVNDSGVAVGDGILDKYSSKLSIVDSNNSDNTVTSSSSDDLDFKVKGT